MKAPLSIFIFCCVVCLATACSRPQPRPYERADAIRYLPATCSVARVYADLAAWGLAFPSGNLTSSSSHAGRLKRLLEAFEESGIRVGQDLQDLAVCIDAVPQDADELSSAVAAMGGHLGGSSALRKYENVILALSSAKRGEIIEARRKGIPYLVGIHQKDRVWIAMPSPDVLVLSTGPITELDTLKRSDAPDLARWRAHPGQLAGFEYISPERATGGIVAHGTVSNRGTELELDVDARFGSLAVMDDAKLLVLRTKLSSLLQTSVLAPLAGPIERSELGLRDGALSVVFRIRPSEIEDAVIEARKNPLGLARLLSQATSSASTR